MIKRGGSNEAAAEQQAPEIGEILARRSITEEQRTVAVEVRQETLRVTRRSVPVRPAAPVEAEAAFRSQVVRIPVLGEEAVVSKRPFVTGEVVVHRRPVMETKTVTESVRREAVETEETEALHTELLEPQERGEPPEQPEQADRSAQPGSHDAFTEVLPVVRPAALWREVREGWSRGRSRA